MYKILAITSKLFILCLLLAGCHNNRLYRDTQLLMGTFVEVISPEEAASQIVFFEMKRIEQILSKYIPDSEISRLNQTGKLQVSADTYYIIKKAKEFSAASFGAFDITVAPLVDLWGFTKKEYSLPAANLINKAKMLVGYDKIVLNDNNNMVEFIIPGMHLDLGAIAKGYAIDLAIRKLQESGIKNCLINAGGQIYSLGDKFGKPWEIALRNPRDKKIFRHLRLKNQSASTSGDYEQYFTAGNKRYSHIIDPRTGRPAHSGIISVTVIAQEGLTADALSTAIFVLGKDEGKRLLKQFPGTRAIIIEEDKINPEKPLLIEYITERPFQAE